MSFSINTNAAALIALKTLTQTNSALDQAQEIVSTGLTVNSALDNASAFVVAQGERSTIKAYDAVNSSLANATTIVTAANTGATDISNLLQDVQAKITALSDGSLSTASRTSYTNNLSSDLSQINTYITSSAINGTNLLSTTTGITFVSNTTGSTLTVHAENLTSALAALAASVPVGSNLSATAARAALASGGAIATFQAVLNTVLGTIGDDNSLINNITSLNTDLQNAVSTGLGAQVDANLAAESATLTALQTKQQLGVQALSIANSAPQILLSLFK